MGVLRTVVVRAAAAMRGLASSAQGTPCPNREAAEGERPGARLGHRSLRASDGTSLFVDVLGLGEPTFVLTDGLACDGVAYKQIAPRLAALGGVVRWNFRGHGRSGSPRDPACSDVHAHVDDLATVLDGAGPGPFVLVGHSFGVQVSLELAARGTHPVLALVALCGASGRVTHTFKGKDWLAQALPSVSRWVEGNPRVARGVWSRLPVGAALRLAGALGEVDLRAARLEDVAAYLEHARQLDVTLFVRMLAAAGTHDARPVLQRIHAPTLVIAGDRDTFTPLALSEQLARALPDAELSVVRGATHALPLEHPAVVAGLVERFLRSRGLVSRSAGAPFRSP